MADKILKVIESSNEVYWMAGHDRQEAIESFGTQITSETMLAIPYDPNMTEFQNIEAAWQASLKNAGG